MRLCSGSSLSFPHDHSKSRDRKSTRLNSSHQIISYAVFCLKKKKKNKNTSEQNSYHEGLYAEKNRNNNELNDNLSTLARRACIDNEISEIHELCRITPIHE